MVVVRHACVPRSQCRCAPNRFGYTVPLLLANLELGLRTKQTTRGAAPMVEKQGLLQRTSMLSSEAAFVRSLRFRFVT